MEKNAQELKINKKDWINHGRWIQAPLSGCFWCCWNSPKSLKDITAQAKFANPLFFDGYLLTKKSDMATIWKILIRIVKNKKVNNFIRSFEKVAKKYEKLHLDILKKEDKNHTIYLPRLFETYQDLIGIWNFSIFFGDGIQEYLLEKNPLYSGKKIIEDSSGLYKKTWLEEQSSEIKNFALEIRKKYKGINKINYVTLSKNLALQKKVKNHVDKFRWFGTHHWTGESYDTRKCLDQINEILSSKEIKNKKTTRQKSKDGLLKALAVMTYWRTHCAELTCKVVFESRPILEKYAKKNGLTYNQLLLLSHREILNNLKHGKELSASKKILSRKKAYGCFVKPNGEEEIITGRLLSETVRGFLGKVNKEDVLKGTVVSPGRTVKGRAKILFEPSDFQKFEKGDILIASETAPDFVPCMKVAAAIVTERGGLTSHAAIVSRELGVPCIIGIKNVTRILRDGDIIEVDTGEGIIKIISAKGGSASGGNKAKQYVHENIQRTHEK